MIFLLFNPHQTPVKKINHVKVRTVRPVSAIKRAPQAAAKPSPTSKKPVAKPQPILKKPATSNKPTVIEKGKALKKVVPKKIEPPAEIWNEIDQALAKIEQKRYPISKQSLNFPQPVTFLDEQSSEEGAEREDSVVSHLMGFLHDTLHLPEVGEVKIEITVRKNGTVAKVVILRAESQKNKLYLQEHIPLLQLPMQFDQEKTWTLTFCNEI